MIPQPANLRHDDNSSFLSVEGLLNEPFAENAAGHFFYAGADGAQRFDLLLHLAPYSPLLLVTGKSGVGKTALLRQFVTRANDSWRIATVTARVDMGRDELLRDMARGFGLSLDNCIEPQALYAALITQLRALRQNAQAPILLLDDAQYLSATMMELVLNLCAENDIGHTLSIVLFGTPQLQSLFASPALTSLTARVTHTFEMTPFTEQETGGYIRHRLRAAGAADDGPFDAILINKVHASSGGIAARINEMARRVLQEKTLDGKEYKAGKGGSGKPEVVKRFTWMAAAALVLVLIVAGPLRTAFLKSPAPAAPRQTATLEVSPPPLTVGDEDHVIHPPGAERAPADTVPSLSEMVSSAPESEKALPLPALSPVTKEVPAPAAEGAPDVAALTPPLPQTPPPPSQAEQAAAPEAAKPQVAKTKPAVHPATRAIRGEEWVRAQPDDRYTLQLAALREEKVARQFIEIHHLQGKAAYFPARRDGQIFYTLVYGVYGTHADAERAAKEVPAKWGVPNPWIRSFKILHDQLEKRPESQGQ